MDRHLGSFGQDKTSGFSGVVTAHVEYQYGVGEVLLTSIDDKNKKLETEWFPIPRIKFSPSDEYYGLVKGRDAFDTSVLGKTGKDVVSGFTGVVNGVIEFLGENIRYHLVSVERDGGKPAEDCWLGRDRVKII